jgi:diguanylate cyclase (GGDEF)-like protein
MPLRAIRLRTALGLAILAMGLLTVALVYFSGEAYRTLALQTQRRALVDLIGLKSADLLDDLGQHATELGLQIQHDARFRAALRERDTDRLHSLLDQRFHQYFVTAGILQLTSLHVLDTDFTAIAESGQGSPEDRSCRGVLDAARLRIGPERLKPLARLCAIDARPRYALLVPIGLQPAGYIELLTDPTHALLALEAALDMPLRLSLADGSSVYASGSWNRTAGDDDRLTASFTLSSAGGEQLVTVSARADMQSLYTRLSRTRDLVLLVVVALTLATMLLAGLIVERIIVRPLQSLSAGLHHYRHGRRSMAGSPAGHTGSMISEFAELKELYRVLEELAQTDRLTGLANRNRFEQRLQPLLSNADDANRRHAVCFLDLDQFKIVNDTCGRRAGDSFLQQISGVIREKVSSDDLVARIGGDEFAILLEDCPPPRAQEIATVLRQAVGDFQFVWDEHAFNVGASIGLVPFSAGSGALPDILNAVDTACHVAKEKGHNRVHIYWPDDMEMARRRSEMQWVTNINHALEENRFRLFAQPIVGIGTEAREHRMHEVLLSMRDDSGQLVAPADFIAAAERYDLMPRIDRWVIDSTCAWLATHGASAAPEHVYAINLSGQSLSDDNFLHHLMAALSNGRIRPRQLCFEVTETAAIANLGKAVRFVSQLREMGCSFSLDDFGSGLSSFTYLKNLHVDYVKIDGSFVKGISSSLTDHRMVEAINQIGHIMNIRTIAECVEDRATLEKVRGIGVDYAQGFCLGRPRPLDEPDPSVAVNGERPRTDGMLPLAQ